uniref:Uncharacterized protein n=1 Tax=Brassica campestris TaxID=3711 RepID=A0A3P6AFH1_BRACM|nr:unnamed protein product [Brassica rapa]
MAIFFLCFSCVLLLVSFVFFLRKIKENKRCSNLPPNPPRLPIIGNLHQLAGLPHRCIHHLSIKYGPVVLLHLGSVPTVVISSSEAAEQVLKLHDLVCCSRPKTVATGKLSYGFKDIGLAQYGEYWREMRKLVVIELFSLKKVRSFRKIREEEVGLMVKKVVALGQNFNESGFFIGKGRLEELLNELVLVLGGFTCSDLFPCGGLGRFLDWLFGGHNRINKVFEELDAFYQHVIDDHLKHEAHAGKKAMDSQADIAALLLGMMDKQGDKDYLKLSIDNIKGVITDIFIAGVDTGAVTMIWAMTELAKNPRVMRKAQEEIRNTLGLKKESISEEDINKHFRFCYQGKQCPMSRSMDMIFLQKHKSYLTYGPSDVTPVGGPTLKHSSLNGLLILAQISKDKALSYYRLVLVEGCVPECQWLLLLWNWDC